MAKALHYVANEIASGKINVGDVYTSKQRTVYADGLPSSLKPTPIHQTGQGVPLKSGPQQQTPTKVRRKTKKATKPRPRTQLVPNDCVLNVTDPRLQDIERELRKLNLGSFPNAVSVLFRVFLELSADCYIQRFGLPVGIAAKLRTKLLEVTKHLVTSNRLTEQQAKPARSAAQTDSYLAPSVTVMHQYVHNQYMYPSPADLCEQAGTTCNHGSWQSGHGKPDR